MQWSAALFGHEEEEEEGTCAVNHLDVLKFTFTHTHQPIEARIPPVEIFVGKPRGT